MRQLIVRLMILPGSSILSRSLGRDRPAEVDRSPFDIPPVHLRYGQSSWTGRRSPHDPRRRQGDHLRFASRQELHRLRLRALLFSLVQTLRRPLWSGRFIVNGDHILTIVAETPRIEAPIVMIVDQRRGDLLVRRVSSPEDRLVNQVPNRRRGLGRLLARFQLDDLRRRRDRNRIRRPSRRAGVAWRSAVVLHHDGSGSGISGRRKGMRRKFVRRALHHGVGCHFSGCCLSSWGVIPVQECQGCAVGCLQLHARSSDVGWVSVGSMRSGLRTASVSR